MTGQWLVVGAGLAVAIAAYLASLGFRGHQYVIGIDLGTTYSVVALKQTMGGIQQSGSQTSEDGKVEVVPNLDTQRLLTPSVVSYVSVAEAMRSGNRAIRFQDGHPALVGDSAQSRRKSHPRSTVFHAKRFIGRSLTEVGADITTHPFQVGNARWADASNGTVEEITSRGLHQVEAFEAVRDGAEDSGVARFADLYSVAGEGVNLNFESVAQTRDRRVRFDQRGVVQLTDKQKRAFDPKSSSKKELVDGDNIESEGSNFQEESDETSIIEQRELHYNQTGAEFLIEEGKMALWRSPVDIGAAIVRTLKASVEKHLGYEVFQTVVTVPAKFGRLETQKTLEAFKQAGFKVARVMDEPTAAAVAYGLHKSAEGS